MDRKGRTQGTRRRVTTMLQFVAIFIGKCQIGKKVRNEMSRGAVSKPFLSPKEQRWDSSLFSLTQMGWGCEPAWGMREAVAKKLASYPMTMSYDRYHVVRENTFKGLRS